MLLGLIWLGSAIVLVGAASLIHLAVLGWNGAPLVEIYGGDQAVTIATPAVVWLLGVAPLFIGELLRRGSFHVRPTGFFRGGSVVTVSGRSRLGWVLAWLAVALAAWALLVPIPVAVALDDPSRGSDGFWLLVGVYGFIAAGIAGVILISLVKRVAHDRAVARRRVSPPRGREFWRLWSGQWRVESILAMAGAGLLGILPLLWRDAAAGEKALDTTAVAVLSAIGVASLLLAAVTALGSWRSGEAFGYAESVA